MARGARGRAKAAARRRVNTGGAVLQAEQNLNRALNRAQVPRLLGPAGAGRGPAGGPAGQALPGQRVNMGVPAARMGKPLNYRGVNLVYNALGSTDSGREWALLALHPCGEYVTTADGIPDETQANAVSPGYRGQSAVGWDANLFTTPPTPPGDFQYDIQLVVLPHAEIDYVYRLGYGGTWSRWVFVHTSNFSRSASASATTLQSAGMSSWRQMGRGLTVHLIAAALADQGQMIAGQIKPIVKTRTADYTLTDATVTAPGEGELLGWGYYVPQDETELVQQDPLAAQWTAKLGCYIPHRFIQPTQLFVDTLTGASATMAVGAGTTTGPAPSTAVWMLKTPTSAIELADIQTIVPPTGTTWANSALYDFVGPSRNDWGVSPPGNTYTSVVFFRGIANTATLQVKTRSYVEAEVVGIDSPSAPFSHRSPTLDRVALDLVCKVGQTQEHVFLASDNDLGSILASIGKILPGIVAPIGDILAGSGIPIVSDIGRVGGGLARKIAGLF